MISKKIGVAIAATTLALLGFAGANTANASTDYSAATHPAVSQQKTTTRAYVLINMSCRTSPHYSASRSGSVWAGHYYWADYEQWSDGEWWTHIQCDNSRWGWVPDQHVVWPV